MRTSRISRDAAKIASSLAASRARTRATATSSQAASAGVQPDAPLPTKEAASDSETAQNDTDSSFSSGLSSPPDDSDFEPTPITPRKRKRGGALPTTTVIKQEKQETALTEIASPKKAAARAKRVSRAPARKKIATNGAVKVEPPPNWEEIYALTREMRNENVAPVCNGCCSENLFAKF